MITIYLIRHSGPFVSLDNDSEVFDEQNRNMILSVEAEEKAKLLSNLKELKNIDKIISSNAARSIATAKYIANENNKVVNIVNEFNERKFGIEYISDLPEDFIKQQFEDENFKLSNGESLLETRNRFNAAMGNILSQKNQRIAIVSHGIAIMNYFKNFCDVTFANNVFKVVHNEETIFNDILNNPPEIFELVFDEHKLINIKNITY